MKPIVEVLWLSLFLFWQSLCNTDNMEQLYKAVRNFFPFAVSTSWGKQMLFLILSVSEGTKYSIEVFLKSSWRAGCIEVHESFLKSFFLLIHLNHFLKEANVDETFSRRVPKRPTFCPVLCLSFLTGARSWNKMREGNCSSMAACVLEPVNCRDNTPGSWVYPISLWNWELRVSRAEIRS